MWLKQNEEQIQHKCELPIFSQLRDVGKIGDVWECNDCTKRWIVKSAEFADRMFKPLRPWHYSFWI